MGGSYAFSVVAYQGIACGAGDTEDCRFSTSVKYRVNIGQLRAAADEVPDRPGRHEPRAVKRRLKAYARLNCERKKFREVSHRNRRLSARAKARENRAAI